MKRILPFIFLLVVLSACATNDGASTPAPYPRDTPAPVEINAPIVESPVLTSIQFLNSLDGWGVTETQIIRTNDGGITWYNVTPPDITETGYSVQFHAFDPNHAWMHLPDFENYPHSGFLYRTVDGGITWTMINSPFSGAQIQFLDPDNGWVLADLGVGAGSNAVAVYQTTDGGVNWNRTFINDPNDGSASESLPLGGLKYGITPLDMKTAWVYGTVYSQGTIYLYRTDNGGAGWEQVKAPLPEGAENYEFSIEADQMKLVSVADGFLIARLTGDVYRAAVYVTHDGGNTWELTPTLIPDGGSADFVSAQGMVIYNGDQFYVTRDAAHTWSIIPPDVKFGDTFAMMDFVDPDTGWVITLDPTNHRSLYRTVDGGATWSPIIP